MFQRKTIKTRMKSNSGFCRDARAADLPKKLVPGVAPSDEARPQNRLSPTPSSVNFQIPRQELPLREESPPRSPRGFTLVELLISISIIALLAALLVPLVGKMTVRARTTECVHRMKQLGTAFHLFAAENNQKLPAQAASGLVGRTDPDGWTRQLFTYTETYKIMACPSSPKANIRVPNSFGYNGWVALNRASTPDGTGPADKNPNMLDAVRLSLSREPSKDVLLIDNYSTASGYATIADSAQSSPISSSVPGMFPHPAPEKGQTKLPSSATRTVLYVGGNVGLLKPVDADRILDKHFKWPVR